MLCLKGIFEWMLDANSFFLLGSGIVQVAMGVKVNVGFDSDLWKTFGLTLRAVLPNLSTISLSNWLKLDPASTGSVSLPSEPKGIEVVTTHNLDVTVPTFPNANLFTL